MTEDATGPEHDRIVGAYVASRNFPGVSVPAGKLTHAFYAFATVEDGGVSEVDDDHLAELRAAREENPDLNVLLSVGGWGQSEGFDEAAATEEARRAFAESAVARTREYDLDGIDVDWEFPAREEREDYARLIATMREAFDEAAAADGREYLLTAATSGVPGEREGTDLSTVHEQFDFVNAMTYDLHYDSRRDEEVPTREHHAPLYESELNERHSVDRSVEAYLDAGVPPEKLVVGVPFYARGTDAVDWVDLAADYLDDEAFERRRDPDAGVPYLVGEDLFLGYDDPESLARKADYVRERDLAGVMFWELGHDPEGTLVSALDGALSGE